MCCPQHPSGKPELLSRNRGGYSGLLAKEEARLLLSTSFHDVLDRYYSQGGGGGGSSNFAATQSTKDQLPRVYLLANKLS